MIFQKLKDVNRLFLQLRVNQENFEEDFISRFSEIPEHSSPNLRRISMINTDQGRTNVIKEILQAEQDYVKHMKDVVEVSRNITSRTRLLNG
jgi:bacterioferritin (cytochrome b1)